jgi:hypothetical protein
MSTVAGLGAGLAMLAQRVISGEYWAEQIALSTVSIALAIVYLVRHRQLRTSPSVAQRVLAWTLISAPVAWHAGALAFALLFAFIMRYFD